MNRLLLQWPWMALPLMLLAAGCQSNEDITSYQVPRQDDTKRLLGAIVPMGDESWFFKFVATPSAVAEHAKEFSASDAVDQAK